MIDNDDVMFEKRRERYTVTVLQFKIRHPICQNYTYIYIFIYINI